MPTVKEKTRHPFFVRILAVMGLLLIACTSLRSTTSNEPRVYITDRMVGVMSLDERTSIVKYASKYVGVPYHFGGTSPSNGFDCSGFTSFVLNNFGLDVPRTSGGQAVLGRAITFDDAQPGDLLFFGKGKDIEHVAIVVRNERNELEMVHSSSSYGVRIENMRESSYWKKRIMFAIDLASL